MEWALESDGVKEGKRGGEVGWEKRLKRSSFWKKRNLFK